MSGPTKVAMGLIYLGISAQQADSTNCQSFIHSLPSILYPLIAGAQAGQYPCELDPHFLLNPLLTELSCL